MKNFSIIICILLLSSCRMQNYCATHYPSVNSDSTYTVETYCWDSVIKYVPYIDLSFDTTGVIDNHVELHKEIKKGGLKGSIDIHNGHINFKCSDDSLKLVIATQEKKLETRRVQVKVVHDPCDKEHKTSWNGFCTYFFWIIVILFILRFAIRYFTGK